MELNEAKKLTNKGKSNSYTYLTENIVISEHLNLPPIKLHCSMLAE